MSKKQNHWYPRYVSDYAIKTGQLTMIEHGAYTLLLDYYYATEKPLDANASVLHRVCRAFAQEEKDALQSVLHKFFTLKDDGWHNTRADEELAKRIDISGKRRLAAYAKHQNIAPENRDANAYTSTPTSTPTSTINNNNYDYGGLAVSPPRPTPSKVNFSNPDWDGGNEDDINPKARVLLDKEKFALPDEFFDYAKPLGWAASEIQAECHKFKFYFTQGKGEGTRRTVKGWRQSWHNWLTNANKRRV